MELRLKNITSYSKEQTTKIDLRKKINIIYGQNGAGKSTISNFFYNMSDASFKECECTFIQHYRPFVYNAKFIEENFFNTAEQKGVFTLSKENADIEKEIAEKESEKQSLTKQYLEKNAYLDNLVENENKAEIKCIDAVWSKTENIRASSLKSLMKGSLGSKKSFFEKLKPSQRLPGIDLNSLIQEYDELLRHNNIESPTITLPIKDFLLPSEHDLLATPIIDLSNSYLSDNIKELNNLDWVKTGKELYLREKTCPFCQEKTISDDFTKAIESIFDESYNKKTNQIKIIKNKLSKEMEDNLQLVELELTQCLILTDDEKNKSLTYIKVLHKILSANISLLNDKINNPSISITLNFDNESYNNIFEDIVKYNIKINDINAKSKTFKRSENIIQGKIWAGAKDFCHIDFDDLSKSSLKNKSLIEIARKDLDLIIKKGKDNNNRISELRTNVSNIDLTIDSINNRLKNLGIDNFSIKKHLSSEDKYVISRADNTSTEGVYRSLSEGEKTLITFLYFIEYCKGKTDKLDYDNRESLIVIDDPISSLSQNYIYDIASMIHFEVLETPQPKKIIILTHNLYFFHELVKLAPRSRNDKIFKRDYSLGRISKNTHSTFEEIEKSSLKNEYQSLWQLLKDAQDGKINKIIIPNIMRNILEYYFAFVHKTDALQAELIKLAKDENNQSFRAFYRFINRGSHSDAVNISDMGDISPQKYIDQLKKIFIMTGDEKHYIKMMEIDEPDEEDEVATA